MERRFPASSLQCWNESQQGLGCCCCRRCCCCWRTPFAIRHSPLPLYCDGSASRATILLRARNHYHLLRRRRRRRRRNIKLGRRPFDFRRAENLLPLLIARQPLSAVRAHRSFVQSACDACVGPARFCALAAAAIWLATQNDRDKSAKRLLQ